MSSRSITGSFRRRFTPKQKTEEKLDNMINTLMNIQTDIRLKQRKLNNITLKLKNARDESNNVKIMQFEPEQQMTINELNQLRDLYNNLLNVARDYSLTHNGDLLSLTGYTTIDVPFGMADESIAIAMGMPDAPTTIALPEAPTTLPRSKGGKRRKSIKKKSKRKSKVKSKRTRNKNPKK